MTDYELGLRHAAIAMRGWVESTVFSGADIASRQLIYDHVRERLLSMADAVAREPEYRLYD